MARSCTALSRLLKDVNTTIDFDTCDEWQPAPIAANCPTCGIPEAMKPQHTELYGKGTSRVARCSKL